MRKLLEKAFDRVGILPEKEQDAVARFLLAELDSEAEWEQAFQSSQDELVTLAEQALAESERAETKPLDLTRDF